MKTAGGIIVLIAGVFAIMAAGVTLTFGGCAGALESEGADTVVYLGVGGLIFSFITIVLGAMCFGAKTKKVGIAIIITSILGALLGGTFVAIFMVLALMGGIFAVIGAGNKPASAPAPTSTQ